MGEDVVREGETLSELSARLGVPGCMLLRANGLFSGAWLLPGRVIAVPDADFCNQGSGVCPVDTARAPALCAMVEAHILPGETAGMIARRVGVTERLVYLAAGGALRWGRAIHIRVPRVACQTITVLPGDTLDSLAARHDTQRTAILALNALESPLYPGMRLMVPA